jgi:predicted ATPase/DNA-binding winged helix-turn-helix (wHTH) protein
MIALGARWIDLGRGVVRSAAGEEALTDREQRLLAALLAADGKPVAAEALITAAWDEGGTPSALLTAVNRLRNKIEADPGAPRYLRTLRNEGYALRPDALVVASEPTLLGREAERLRLEEAAGPGALVTLTGPAGAGKTTLARSLLAGRPGRNVFVELATARDLADVVRLVAEATGAPIDGRAPERDLGTVRGWLGRFGAVVLDNAEQAADAVGAAVECWRGAATVVVTSRVVLGVEGEQRVDLGPLPPEAARDLFRRRAEAVGARDVADDPLVDRIVERLDRLPLAILLAAGRMGVFSAEELLQRLQASLGTASEATAEMPARHRGLDAAFAGSWDLLDAATRRVMGSLSVFPAGFGIAEAAAVAGGPVLEALQIALDASLLRAAGRPGRVALYEIVRRLVSERSPAEELRAAESRHAAWAVSAAEARLPEIDRADGAAARDALGLLLPDLLAVVRRAVPADLVVRAAVAADTVLAPWGQLDRRLELLDRALPLASDDQRAAVRARRAQVLERMGDPRAAAELEAALELARAGGDRGVESDLLVVLGMKEARAGRDPIATFEAAIAAAGDDLARASRPQVLIGRWLCDLGQPERGREMLAEAADRLAAAGQGRAEADARLHLAIAQRVVADDAAAEATNLRALALARQLGDVRIEARTLCHLGSLQLDAGRPDEALETLAHAGGLAGPLGEPRLVWVARLHTIRARVDRGEVGEALAEVGKLPLDEPELVAQAVYLRATALARGGQWQAAAAALDGFGFDPHRDHELHDLANALRAVVAAHLGDLGAARAALARPPSPMADTRLVAPVTELAHAALDAGSRAEALARAAGSAAVDVRLMRRLVAQLG